MIKTFLVVNRIMQVKHKQIIRITALLMLLSAVLFYAIIYMMERPGGLSDRRMSRALGQKLPFISHSGRPRIKRSNGLEVHRRWKSFTENLLKGQPLFMRRYNQTDSSNLQVEYVRKTWIGWKWVWGGDSGSVNPYNQNHHSTI